MKKSKKKHGTRNDFEKSNAEFIDRVQAPVPVDTFLFYFDLAINAAEFKTPTTNPVKYGFTLIENDGSEQSYNFTDNPINRMVVAIKENMTEEEIQDLFPSVIARIFSLQALMGHKDLSSWIRSSQDNPDTVLVHPAVLAAAASAPIEEMSFNLEKFLRLIAEISAQMPDVG